MMNIARRLGLAVKNGPLFRTSLRVQNSLSPVKNIQHRLRHVRFSHSQPLSVKERLETEGLPTGLSLKDIQAIAAHTKSLWPPPPRLPLSSSQNDWSSSWESWPYLLTFYWQSPHYLQIPQIDMIANILYRLPGKTRGVLFSNERCQFIFTFHENANRFFLYDMYEESLYEFVGVQDEDQLVARIEIDVENKVDEKEKWGLKLLEPDAEGQDAIRRIMERDETVIPLLAEKFLDYTPEHTTPWQEDQVVTDFLSKEQKERLEQLAGELASQNREIGEEEVIGELMKEIEAEFKRGQDRVVEGNVEKDIPPA